MLSKTLNAREQKATKISADKQIGDLFVKRLKISFKQLVETSLPLFEKANTPASLALWLMLKHGEYEQYLRYECDPLSYTDHVKFRRDWQCAKVFSKSEIYPKVINTRQVAVREFIKCEMDCRSLNRRIFKDGFRSLFSDAEWPVIYEATRKISHILKGAPTLEELDCHFGPGQNIGLDDERKTIVDKLNADRTITQGCLRKLRENPSLHPMWDAIFAGQPDEYPPLPVCPLYSVVPGSRLTFVPKNAKTDRPICVEPLMNGFMQTGVGSLIKSRLKKSGCDLTRQARNQRKAWQGSLTNDIATVDLSSASDTIAYSVVLEMLPYEWFDLLDSLRSPCFTYEGTAYPFEKFSSMGNAYTFELESLIFLAVTRAVVESQKGDIRSVSVYGDDITCPSSCYPLLKTLLGKLGFRVSESKSFIHGPFRESCGKDYFLGNNVRPIYLKSVPSPQSLMVWLNGIHRAAGPGLEDPVLRSWYFALRSLLPKPFQALKGPDGYGDGHLITCKPVKVRRNVDGWEGQSFYTLQAVSSHKPFPNHVVRALASYAIGKAGLSDSLKQKVISYDGASGPMLVPTYANAFDRGRSRYKVVRSSQRWRDPGCDETGTPV